MPRNPRHKTHATPTNVAEVEEVGFVAVHDDEEPQELDFDRPDFRSR